MMISRLNCLRTWVKMLMCTLLLTAFLPAFGQSYIRINQMGYVPGVQSQAYLMTSLASSSPPFIVKNVTTGQVVASGTVGSKKLGAWGSSYSVYPIVFTPIMPIGSGQQYTIYVGGSVNTTSPKFIIDTDANLYTSALANTLSFYQNERDGANFIPSALRTAAGHLNDAYATAYNSPIFNNNDEITKNLVPVPDATTINVEGGWWDAGDYLKFVQTHSYVVALMLVGVRDFPNQMGADSATSNFTNEAKFGLDWLQQMWNDNTKTLYYQVGIGTDFSNNPSILSDHDIWRLPQVDDSLGTASYMYISHRPVFIAGPAGSPISPNLAGRLTADFALCYTTFKSTNSPYADQCLQSAEDVFALANTSPGKQLLTVAPYDFYPEIEWRDDLELGATELYFALHYALVNGYALPPNLPQTNPSYYLTQAANWAYAYIHGPNDGGDTLNLYDVAGLAHFELYRAIGVAGNPAGLKVTQAQLLSDLAYQIQQSTSQAEDPFGSPYNWSYGDTVSHVSGLSVMAAEYNYLKNSSTYPADRWAGSVLGANPWGVSFIVGDGSTFPFCMQHQVANLMGTTDGTPPVLAGAAVEGPTNASSSGLVTGMVTCPPQGGDVYKAFNAKDAVYKDNVQSYATNEPAIDLTAASMLMFAWQIAGAPSGTP